MVSKLYHITIAMEIHETRISLKVATGKYALKIVISHA
jgi:hypothetical protein